MRPYTHRFSIRWIPCALLALGLSIGFAQDAAPTTSNHDSALSPTKEQYLNTTGAVRMMETVKLPRPRHAETTQTFRLGSLWKQLLASMGMTPDDLFVFVGTPYLSPEDQGDIQARRHYWLGQYYLEMEQPAQAVGEFRAALEERPDSIAIKTALADAYILARDYDRAQAVLTEVLSQETTNVEALIIKAHLAMSRAEEADGKERAKLLDEAVEAFEQAKQVQPKNLDVLRGLVQVYTAKRDIERVIQAYRDLVAANPKDTYSMFVLANILARTGKRAEARALYEKVIEQRRGFVNGYIYLGLLLEEMGETAEALETYKRALLIEPRNPQLQRVFESMLERMTRGKGRQAFLKEYAKFASEYPYSTEIQRLYADQLAKANDTQAALRQYQRVLELDPENVDALVAAAGLLAKAGKYEEASQYYAKAIELAPERSEIYDGMATTFMQVKDRKQAIAVLQKALQLNPKVPMLYVNIASLLQQEGKPEEAEKILEQGIEKLGEKAEFFIALGEIAERKNDLAKATTAIRKAYELAPSNQLLFGRLLGLLVRQERFSEVPELLKQAENTFRANLTEFYLLVAETFLSEGVLDRAAEYYEKVIEAAPDKLPGYGRLVQIYNVLDQHEKALAVIERAKKQFPDSEDVQRMLADTYLDAKEYAKAVEICRKLIEAKPKSLDGYRLLVDALNKANRYEEALAAVKEAEQQVGTTEETEALRAVALFQQKRYDQAAAIFTKLAEKKNKNADFYLYMLGSIYLEQKRFDQAEKMLRQAIERNPLNDAALNALGYMFAEQGRNLEEAKELIERALAINPNAGHILDSLGWVYFRMNKLEEALRYVQKAHRLMGDDPEILKHLGDIYNAMGKRAEAAEYWKRSLALDPTQADVKANLMASEKKKKQK